MRKFGVRGINPIFSIEGDSFYKLKKRGLENHEKARVCYDKCGSYCSGLSVCDYGYQKGIIDGAERVVLGEPCLYPNSLFERLLVQEGLK